ncbi:25827_t:CDS:1, partial [Racocetra persica]
CSNTYLKPISNIHQHELFALKDIPFLKFKLNENAVMDNQRYLFVLMSLLYIVCFVSAQMPSIGSFPHSFPSNKLSGASKNAPQLSMP